jgi:hypothetical protein
MKILLAIGFLALPVFGQAPSGPVQGPPPKNLTKQADGHVSANTVPANPANFVTHVVQQGETLSQISELVLKDSRLWPQLWEMNEHIVNPHWIYPDDKILIRPITKITDATPPPPTPTAPAPPAAVAEVPRVPETPAVPASVGIAVLSRFAANSLAAVPRAKDVFDLPPQRLTPGLKSSDVYCSGFIRSAPVPDTLYVAATYQRDKATFSTQGEYIRINQGSRGGVTVGTMYQVVRPTMRVQDPSRSGGAGKLGMHYLDVAQIEIVLAQPDFALARINASCDAAEIGDVLTPYVTLEIPDLPRNRPFASSMTTAGDAKGTVAFMRNAVAVAGSVYSSPTAPSANSIIAAGGVVYINLGKGDGVKAGDLFIVYHGNAAIAELAVLKVDDRSSSALVTYSTDALRLGDHVERR